MAWATARTRLPPSERCPSFHFAFRPHLPLATVPSYWRRSAPKNRVKSAGVIVKWIDKREGSQDKLSLWRQYLTKRSA